MTHAASPPSAKTARAEAALAKHAESKLEVTEHRPWGHRAFKVKGKTFLFLTASAEGLSLSVKLPESRRAALALPFAEPTHYGLGKSGWVTANLAPSAAVPLELLRGWVDESYRAIAPKKLLAPSPGARKKMKTKAKKAAPSSSLRSGNPGARASGARRRSPA